MDSEARSAACTDDRRLIAECDGGVLAQWRDKNLGYAADVVEAYQRELARAQKHIERLALPDREHAGVTAGGSSTAAPRHAPAEHPAATPAEPGGYVVPDVADSDDDGFRARCDGMDGPLPCSKPAGHSGPHYFYIP